MENLSTAALILTALIHLPPVLGVMGQKPLEKLYALPMEEANLLILMRHRALLFGLLAGFLLYAAFVPHLQGVGLIVGLISTVSFVGFAMANKPYNTAVKRVVMADLVAIAALSAALTAKLI